MLRAAAGLVALASILPVPALAASKCGPAMVQLVVLDPGGSSLSGLDPSDFKVRIKGQNATVKAMDYGLFPHSTLLLVSRDNSMGQSIKIDLARQLANSVVNSAPGPAMNGSFAGEVSGIADARSQPVTAALQAASDNRNAMYDAIVAGMSTMNLHRGDSVVVLADSPDNGSKTTATELQQQLLNHGARLFVIALPPANGSGTMQSLSDLADATGGAVIVPLRLDESTKGVVITPSQVDGAVTTFSHTFSQYNNIYQLETDLDGQEKPQPLKVDVNRSKMGSGKVVAPTMLAPCTAI
ncbi:hypothetical protein Acid345_1411 [Candidatus Koribacter versatilis Ellin345]|uniref:VWFA domain-containing protein n=1 Tax=Koribacter versatilis (strain Ellin345) TaxID=204669 RepID=Q1IRT7_KORVE|nr:hypothetical protein [Candidatus Koribacter versatilis]ABF40413.1 hypothetical protein Acid345_1411 [Candidatus Koribacter versatilis Ellin345]